MEFRTVFTREGKKTDYPKMNVEVLGRGRSDGFRGKRYI